MRKQLTAVGIVLVSIFGTARSASAQTMPSWASGKEVRVSLDDASVQSGKLRSLSPMEVVVRQNGKNIQLPLTRVQVVVTMSRPVRRYALTGTLVGALAGPLLLNCRGGECPEAIIEVPVTAGIGAAAGAIIGAVVGRMQPARPHRVVYEARSRRSQFVLTPVASRTVRGLSLTVRW